MPYPRDRESFLALVILGGELRALHLLESPKVEEYITTFPVVGSGEVEKVIFHYPELEKVNSDEARREATLGYSGSSSKKDEDAETSSA